MSTKVTIAELKPGDVLLYQSNSFVARMIRLFDGSEYSHCSIYDGSHIAEAIGKGVVSNTVVDSVEGAEYVHVYRFRSDSGTLLGDLGFPADPIQKRVKYYVDKGDRYAYEQIVFLAILVTTRRLPLNGWIPGLGTLLRTILDSATEVLNRIIADGKEPMICSELVYRCFSEADSKYRLRIDGADILMLNSLHEAALRKVSPLRNFEEGDRELQELSAATEVFLQSYAAAKRAQTTLGTLVTGEVVADFVTPRDIKTTPNLTLLGRLTV